jgi:hypothetical protein
MDLEFMDLEFMDLEFIAVDRLGEAGGGYPRYDLTLKAVEAETEALCCHSSENLSQ